MHGQKRACNTGKYCPLTDQSNWVIIGSNIIKQVIFIITPHAQRERGKVINRGVHIYIYMSVDEKNI